MPLLYKLVTRSSGAALGLLILSRSYYSQYFTRLISSPRCLVLRYHRLPHRRISLYLGFLARRRHPRVTMVESRQPAVWRPAQLADLVDCGLRSAGSDLPWEQRSFQRFHWRWVVGFHVSLGELII